MNSKLICYVVFTFHCFFSLAQQPDASPVVIKNSLEEYRFIIGAKGSEVQVAQVLETHYQSKSLGAQIRVAEFYNNQVEIKEVEVNLDGKLLRSLAPTYEYYNIDDVFYSDARVCHFPLGFGKTGSIAKVKFEKRVLDPRYFTSIYFSEPYFIEKKTVNIIVPSWITVEIKEYNFSGYAIVKSTNTKGENTVYTFTITELPAYSEETHAPGITYVIPHLLIMCKYAKIDEKRLVYFNTLEDQYKWYHKLVLEIGNDPSIIKSKSEEIVRGLTNESDKVKAIYTWVQENIRYLAFEDGIAGFKPDKAQEVLRKKYGDCKGIANLMTEMLKAIGLDARLCWLGTNHIAYDYTTPSLSVDNHMICAWMSKNKIYFLDGTEKYLGFDEIAERIQGRQTLVEDGERYLLRNIPVEGPIQNTAIEKRNLKLEGTNLSGKVEHVWKGESKEWLLNQLNELKSANREATLKNYLANGNPNYQISNLRYTDLNKFNDDFKVEYDLIYKNIASSFGKELYLDINDRKDFGQRKIDTSGRKQPYWFLFKDHKIFEAVLLIPAGSKLIEMPESININRPEYSISGIFKLEKEQLNYRVEIILKTARFPRSLLAQWNEDIGKLNNFYNNQISLATQ